MYITDSASRHKLTKNTYHTDTAVQRVCCDVMSSQIPYAAQ